MMASENPPFPERFEDVLRFNDDANDHEIVFSYKPTFDPFLRVWAGMIGLLLILGVIPAGFGINERNTAIALNERGVSTLAEVLSVRSTSGKYGHAHYPTVRFTDDRGMKREAELPDNDVLKVGDKIRILYFPEDPIRADVEGAPGYLSNSSRFFRIAYLFWGLAIFILCYALYNQSKWRKNERRQQEANLKIQAMIEQTESRAPLLKSQDDSGDSVNP